MCGSGSPDRRQDALYRTRQSLGNGYCKSLNSRLRDKLLNGEIFTTLREAQVLIENWRRHYNTVIPHSSLTYRPPAPEPILPPHFPDGTVLVKEVFKRTTKDMTTGTVSSAGALAGWFVMVKDNVGRFPGTSFGATAGVGPGSTQLIPRRLHLPTTRRTVSPVTCRRDSQTGSTLTAIRS